VRFRPRLRSDGLVVIIITCPAVSLAILVDRNTNIVGMSPTIGRIGLDQRLEEDQHPCRKRGHPRGEIGLERRSHGRIFEELRELALDLLAFPIANQEIA
jgi:hypothetical protein